MMDQRTLDNMIVVNDVFGILTYFKEWSLWHNDKGYACELSDGSEAHSEYDAKSPVVAVYNATAKFIKKKV